MLISEGVLTAPVLGAGAVLTVTGLRNRPEENGL